MARVTFDSVFRKHEGGALEPKQRIRVGGVSFGPGVRFTRGASFGGIDFTLFVDQDLQVETDGDVLVIRGIYGKNQE